MTNKEFKGLKRTVKRVLKGELCPVMFNENCKNDKLLMNALTAVLNKNVEHKDLGFKWYK